MKEYVALVGLAKSRIDNGFSQVGRSLKEDSAADRALMLLASRAVAVSNAVCVLAQNDHANEALPLLRSLVELAVRARHIAEADAEGRAAAFLAEAAAADFHEFWRAESLDAALERYGFSQAHRARARKLLHHHLNANASGLPWGHVYAKHHAEAVSSEEVARLAAEAMGHVVRALEQRWPLKFEGADQIWKQLDQTRKQNEGSAS